MKNRILSLFVVLAMVFTMIPLAVSAESTTNSDSSKTTESTLVSNDGVDNSKSQANTEKSETANSNVSTAKELQDVIDGAQNGATITLIADITLENTVNITAGKKITIDLNGKTIDFNSNVWVYGAANNGTALLTVNFGGDLTIEDTSKEQTGKIDGSADVNDVYGAVMMTAKGDNAENGVAKLTVNGGTLIGGYAAIAGNKDRDNTEIVINGGVIKAGISDSYSTAGIEHPMNGKLTVNGGTIEGMDGISLRSGTLVITGGTIIGNAPTTAFEDDGYWDNDFGTCTGHALQIVSRDNSNPANETPSVTITGGTFESKNTSAVGSYAGYKGETPDTQIVGFISGGTFSSAIDEDLLVEGFKLVENNGTYVVNAGLSGSGTESDPYLISSLEDLILFRNSVNAGKTTYNAPDVYVALNADIDMKDVDWSVNIGDDCNVTFDGIFDGKGYTIYNLNSTETAQKVDDYVCTGLFGAIFGSAVIKNLTIENADIDAGDFTGNNVGVVVGFVYNGAGSIENVTVRGTIKINAPGVYAVGTIVGYAYQSESLTINNCVVTGDENSTIKSVSGAGAIIGYCGGKATIENCEVSNLSIEGKGLIGGIAGIALGTFVFDACRVNEVTLITTKDEWINGSAIVVGTLGSDGLTVSNTTYSNVIANSEVIDRIVGSTYIEHPTDVVPAVQARIGNVYYATLAAAIEAAKNGDTIVLTNNVDMSDTVISIKNVITIDLNGNSLKAAGVSIFAKGASIVDNGETKGILEVPEGFLKMGDAEYPMLPVWNESNGYIFVEINAQNKIELIDNDSFIITLRPEFYGADAKDFFSNGASDNGITISINIKCIKDGAVLETLEFKAPENTVESIYTNNKAATLTINGAGAAFDSYEIEIVLESDTGLDYSVTIGSFANGILTPAQ